MTKKIYCTLDTETVGGCTKPKGFYHIGGLIHDRSGDILASFNMIVADMFEEIRHDDYAKKNFHLYEQMVQEGTASMVDDEESALDVIAGLCDFYDVSTMAAFNSGFDFGKTKAGRLLDGREFIDLYLMAMQTIGQKASYAKFCRENRMLSSSKKNIAGSVQSFTAYLRNDPDFKEAHTAFDDALNEMALFLAALKMHKNAPIFCAKSHLAF